MSAAAPSKSWAKAVRAAGSKIGMLETPAVRPKFQHGFHHTNLGVYVTKAWLL